ncbi:unnamed protein product [Calypogeia fissa]
MYRAIVQRGYNAEDPESTLELVSKPIPTAAPGYVVVHVILRPVNPVDLNIIRSGRLTKGHQNPVTPGSEGFGLVEKIGEGVTRVQPGQRVVLLTSGQTNTEGSWQEFVSLEEDLVVPIPDSISDEAAALFVINPWTLIGMLEDLQAPKGEHIINTAAGSVLGRQLIQLAKHQGVKTINIVRREEQKEELLALGADEVICSTTEDIVARVRDITSGKLAYGGLDCVGGDTTKAVAASVRDKGHVFVYGLMSSPDVTVGIMDLFRGVLVQAWRLHSKWDEREHMSKQTIALLEAKVIKPLAGEKFDLADFKEAIEKSQGVGRGGKVLLTSAAV